MGHFSAKNQNKLLIWKIPTSPIVQMSSYRHIHLPDANSFKQNCKHKRHIEITGEKIRRADIPDKSVTYPWDLNIKSAAFLEVNYKFFPLLYYTQELYTFCLAL